MVKGHSGFHDFAELITLIGFLFTGHKHQFFWFILAGTSFIPSGFISGRF